MQSGKVTFSQAAKLLSLHPNTLKNWQKAGKLATAEKGKVNGVITWLVELEEVTAVNQQSYTILDAGAPYQPPQAAQEPPEPVEQSQPDPPKQDTQTTQIQPNIEATLTIFRESVVAPLTALIKDQGNQIADLSARNGQLEERVKNLEEQLAAARTAPQPQPAPQPARPDQITVQPVETPQEPPQPQPQTQPKKKRWWQFKI